MVSVPGPDGKLRALEVENAIPEDISAFSSIFLSSLDLVHL